MKMEMRGALGWDGFKPCMSGHFQTTVFRPDLQLLMQHQCPRKGTPRAFLCMMACCSLCGLLPPWSSGHLVFVSFFQNQFCSSSVVPTVWLFLFCCRFFSAFCRIHPTKEVESTFKEVGSKEATSTPHRLSIACVSGILLLILIRVVGWKFVVFEKHLQKEQKSGFQDCSC